MKNLKPFLIALAPLIIGLGIYFIYWRGEAEALSTAISSVTGEDAGVAGFPYRLNARLNGLTVERGGENAAVRIVAGESEIGSGPFRAGLYVGYLRDVEVDAASGLPSLTAKITAPEARGSLRADALIERLSMRFERATVETPLFNRPVTARELELHFRETPNPTPSDMATPPGQAEGRLAGLFDFANAASVRVSLPLVVTATAPLTSLSGWRDGGTVEVENAEIAIGGAPLATFDATLAPLPDGALAIAGTLTTDCPLTTTALLTGRPAPAEEFRTRRAAEIALGGSLGDLSLRRLDTASGGRVRSQEPPCPGLKETSSRP
ncbi:MAG: hypothetical protein WA979_06875 [Pacificimonas sp.]